MIIKCENENYVEFQTGKHLSVIFLFRMLCKKEILFMAKGYALYCGQIPGTHVAK
jgi:hypothetical protein